MITVKDDSKKDDFNDVIEKSYKQINSYCFHMLRNNEEAQDAVQEVFLKAYNSFDKSRLQTVLPWLYRIAYNHCINIIKRKNILQFVGIEENMISKELSYYNHSDNEFSQEITDILYTLSPVERTVVILRTTENMSYDEISNIIKKSPESLRKHYERAKKKIKKKLSVMEGEILSESTSII